VSRVRLNLGPNHDLGGGAVPPGPQCGTAPDIAQSDINETKLSITVYAAKTFLRCRH